MAEDKEKDKKPKATLIKHRKSGPTEAARDETSKPEDQASESKQEKKKVRVVLKRKAKSAEEKGAEESARQTQPSGQEGQEAPEGRTASTSQPSQPQERAERRGPAEGAERAARESAGQSRERTEQARPQEQRESGRPQARRSETPQARRTESPQGRPGEPPQRRREESPQARRQPERREARSGGGRPQQRERTQESGRGRPQEGGRRTQQSPPKTQARGGRGGPPQKEEKKPAGKKFFKTKKREQYPKKKEQPQEKELQYRPKQKPQQRVSAVPKEIDIMEVVTVSDLAKKMNLKASDLISKLMSMGMMVTINQQIDAETAQLLADEYGCKVNVVSLYDETVIETAEDQADQLESRPPVVTVMGHVDHGKTKLLDAVRSTDVASGEFGGITQHIGAYQVELPQGGRITFVDTPGHEAFTMMRARGAQVTDIVILVVAADDGVMPQTREAISHAREAKVPIIAAINKIDLPDANPERVKQELAELDLVPEEWGGNTLYSNISALKHEGIKELMDTVLLQAEVLELKANYNRSAEGSVIESKVDPGRGTVSTVLVQRGTLHVGDNFVAGVYPGRVRAMFNDRGERIEEAGPSTPVEIIGLTGLPDAGDPFQVTESERVARQVGDKRQELKKIEDAQNVKKVTLDNLYESIQEGEIQELKVIIKGDVQGSVEALEDALEKLSTQEIRLNTIQATAGAVNESDVRLASASNAIIIAFHVRATGRAQEMAEREKVEIRKYNVIYEVVDDIKAAMEGMLEPERKEETVGNVEVRDVFKVPKIGLVAGCYVTSGKVRRNANVHVIRDGIQVYTGKISSLKRFQDDVREVDAGYECGIGIQGFNDVKVGDELEVFEIREIERKLEQAGQKR